MSAGIVARGWASYREQVLPADASEVQVQECQRAFYAGATTVFYGIMAAASEGPGEPTAADDAMMGGIELELARFADAVGGARS